MILQSLSKLYERKLALEEIAPPGLERKELQFLIVIKPGGEFASLEDLRDAKGRGRAFFVPASVVRTVQIIPNSLWDNAAYVLGIGAKHPEERLASFKAKTSEILEEVQDIGATSLLAFMCSVPNKALEQDPLFADLVDSTGNIGFRLTGEHGLISDRPAIRHALENQKSNSAAGAQKARCLVTGELDEIERIHPPIKGLMNGQPSGTSMVSFNLDAFRSHGKEQGSNAPVGKKSAFAYTTALNSLLAKESRQKILLADTTFVFWSERKDEIEDAIADLFGSTVEDDPARKTEAIRAIYRAAEAGQRPAEGSDEFYLLGLGANAARTVVRHWQMSTTSEIANNIKSYFEDMSLEHGQRAPEFPSLSYLLDALAPNGDRKRLSPQLASSLIATAMRKEPVDAVIAQAAIQRLKSDHKQWGFWLYARCCILKAYLIRSSTQGSTDKRRVSMSLDTENESPAYRLGRLFATLERAQELANPGINATIRERFYGAASTTPVVVFPRLLKLKNHHVAKLKNKVWLEKLIGEILEPIKVIPNHLMLAEQASFAIGYYHQRQAFFHRSDDKEIEETGEVQCQM